MSRRLLLFIAVLMPVSLHAQSAGAHRQGFWFRAGVANGIASCNASGLDCAARTTAPALSLQAGGAFRRSLLLGIDLEAWQHDAVVNGARESHALGFLLADVSWYPSATRNFYVRAGGGTTTMSVKPTSGSLIQSLGPAIGFGMGYDIHIAESFSLTPYFSFATALGASRDSTANGARVQGRLMQIGASFSLY